MAKQIEINLTNLADTEQVILRKTKIDAIRFVSGFLCGGWMGNSVKPEVCQIKHNKDELIVQMHLYADNYCKGVQLRLKQKGDDICGKIEWAKGTKRRAERNERIEKILQSDWNDTSDADVANLDTNIPIGKKGYGVEKIIVEIEPQEEVLKEEAKKQEAKPKTTQPQETKATETKTDEKKSQPIVTEKESNPMVKITPVDLPPVTVERKINQLGLTLTKTYDKFAEAPIQGVDAAGRRTVIATMPVLPDSNKNHDVSLNQNITISGNLLEVAKKCFAAVSVNNRMPLYTKLFWEYLAKNYNHSQLKVERGHTLQSTFGVVSILPDFKHTLSAAGDNIESQQTIFSFENNFCDSELSPEDVVTLFTAENAVDINNDEITFSSPKYKKLRTVLGSYKTPKGFNNTCPECGGEAKIRCEQCEGSGREQYQEGNYADGRPKIKTGQCSRCYGRGFFVCKACNETGKIDQGTGMIQIVETAENKLRLREKVVVSNTFFTNTNNIEPDLSTICKTQRDIENKKEKNKKLKKKLIQELEENCNTLFNLMEEQKLATFFKGYVKEVDVTEEDDDYPVTRLEITYHVKINGKYYNISSMDFSIPWHAEVLLYAWMYPKEEISCDYNDTEIGSIVKQLNINNDCGVGSTLKQLKELEKSDLSKEEKQLENLYNNLFSPKDVEVIFKSQSEISFDNAHGSLRNNIPHKELVFLYQQNVQKAKDVFKLDNKDERIVAILEKHKVVDPLLKISIPLENDKIFTVYYSQTSSSLLYSGELPKIQEVLKRKEKKERELEQKRLEEERLEQQRIEEQRKRLEEERQERARKEEEQRQAKYSQSMDKLLNKKPTSNIGVLSKLFKSESYKEAKDAEKAVKLMIYMAKADGVLDINEKESLTLAIPYTFKEAYTVENRQKFIDMLDSDSLPELTKEDVTFSSPAALNKALKKMEEMAVIGGISPKEKELLELVRKLAGICK